MKAKVNKKLAKVVFKYSFTASTNDIWKKVIWITIYKSGQFVTRLGLL